MLSLIFWLAVACGMAGALTGNRTALALLASVGLCLVLDHFHVPFVPFFWMMLDLAVCWVIIRPTMTSADVVVLALFIPAWLFYFMPEATRYQGGFTVVVLQLVLTFPLVELRNGLRALRERRNGGDHLPMVAAR